MLFEKTDEQKNPYTKVAQWPTGDPKKEERKENVQLMMQVMEGKIKSLAFNGNEDTVMFCTEKNQLMKTTKVNLERPGDETRYQFTTYSFHQQVIKGLDVCIKK